MVFKNLKRNIYDIRKPDYEEKLIDFKLKKGI